jgi:hypothetical protein
MRETTTAALKAGWRGERFGDSWRRILESFAVRLHDKEKH